MKAFDLAIFNIADKPLNFNDLIYNFFIDLFIYHIYNRFISISKQE